MELSRTSFDILSHFEPPPSTARSRGVFWVLKWAAALGVLSYAGCVLLQLAYCLAAERALSHAARAGVLEATLPRATRSSIQDMVKRRLLTGAIPTAALQIVVQQNAAPMPRLFRLADGDRVSVALTVPTHAVLPAWLNAIPACGHDARIEARSERSLPSRQLR
jgi:hypothetical protein